MNTSKAMPLQSVLNLAAGVNPAARGHEPAINRREWSIFHFETPPSFVGIVASGPRYFQR
jgi:hypothetical protein